jgi:hypothetical protein
MFLKREAKRLERKKRAAVIRGRMHRQVLRLEARKLDPYQSPVAAGLALASAVLAAYRRWSD